MLSVVQGTSPAGRRGQLAVFLYVVLSIASAVWAMSAVGRVGNALGALIELRSGDGGTQTLVFDNRSDADWTGVNIIVDQRYVLTLDRFAPGEPMLLSMDEFEDGYRLPRPLGMFEYERVNAAQGYPPSTAPTRQHHPSRVRLVTDQGEFTTNEL
jgi:hypothetical protein